jgi:hypothetical protein
MKPVAWMSKNGILFKEMPPGEMDLIPLYAEEQIEALKAQISYLESKVYGGITK